MIIRKSPREIDKMAAAGGLVAETIAHVGSLLAPGVTTDELDAAADSFIREHGGIPTSAGYKGYPKAICISPNDVVVHGIPGAFEVSEGDLVTIDVGVTLDGYIADSAYTFGVGEIDDESRRLLEVAQEALAAGIAEAVVGNRVGDVSHAVQTVVEAGGFSVVRSLVGHGVGRHYHEDPHIPNFGEPGRGPRLSDGMTIAIEPMITAGSPEIEIGDDGWTVTAADGSMSAHFEHTVAITDAGPRILTPSGRDSGQRRCATMTRRRAELVLCAAEVPDSVSESLPTPIPVVHASEGISAVRGRGWSSRGCQGREDRSGRRGRRGAPEPGVQGAARFGARGAREDLREDAEELHPPPAWRPRLTRALSLRPHARPHHLQAEQVASER